jgi:TPP-dependent indolepyruvate ferredoxin oxidoreductase alpha subunit
MPPKSKRNTGRYLQSGVYQLQCNECPLKYIGQTGRTFRDRYKEHINAIRFNKPHSKFALHILNTGHSYNTIEETLKVLHVEKRLKLNTLERLYDLTKRSALERYIY